MKEYYVFSYQGITTKLLQPGKNIAGELAYYINLKATSAEDEYFEPSSVFNEYDDALAYFCSKIAGKIVCHKKAIEALEDAYASQLNH
jgi:hypothetical protein